MAYDYTYVPNGNLETGKPARAVDIRSIRDMSLAIIEGSPGAPGIRAAGLWKPTAGDVAMLAAPNVAEAAGTTLLTLVSAKFMAFGTVRLKVTARKLASAGVGTMILRRIRNGITTALDSVVLTTTAQTRSVDVTVKPHDTIALVVTRAVTGATGPDVTATGISINTGGEDLWLFDYAPADAVLNNGSAP